MSVAEAMANYTKLAQRYQDYLDRTGYDRLPHAGTLKRLGAAMRAAEKDVDIAIIALVRGVDTPPRASGAGGDAP